MYNVEMSEQPLLCYICVSEWTQTYTRQKVREWCQMGRRQTSLCFVIMKNMFEGHPRCLPRSDLDRQPFAVEQKYLVFQNGLSTAPPATELPWQVVLLIVSNCLQLNCIACHRSTVLMILANQTKICVDFRKWTTVCSSTALPVTDQLPYRSSITKPRSVLPFENGQLFAAQPLCLKTQINSLDDPWHAQDASLSPFDPEIYL